MKETIKDSPTGKKFAEGKHKRGVGGKFVPNPSKTKADSFKKENTEEKPPERATFNKSDEKGHNTDLGGENVESGGDLVDIFCKANGFKKITSKGENDILKRGSYNVSYNSKTRRWTLTKSGETLKSGFGLTKLGNYLKANP